MWCVLSETVCYCSYKLARLGLILQFANFTINSFILRMSTPTRMQRVAVLCWVLAFFVFFLIAPVLTMLLLFTPFRVIVIVYLLWIYLIDSKTSENGGRSSEIFHNFFLWKYIRDYFPVKSVLAVPLELDPKRNYVVAVFPHGIYTIGRFLPT